jgi:hypothetical protein
MPHDDGPEVMQATTGRWYGKSRNKLKEQPKGTRKNLIKPFIYA